jgi:hypothetical protein
MESLSQVLTHFLFLDIPSLAAASGSRNLQTDLLDAPVACHILLHSLVYRLLQYQYS